jgi:hypothetical protein
VPPSVHYEIRVNGVLSSSWSAWFEGLRVTSDEHGQTTIAGHIADQAALHGLLAKVRDLGLELLEVRRTVATRLQVFPMPPAGDRTEAGQ